MVKPESGRPDRVVEESIRARTGGKRRRGRGNPLPQWNSIERWDMPIKTAKKNWMKDKSIDWKNSGKSGLSKKLPPLKGGSFFCSFSIDQLYAWVRI